MSFTCWVGAWTATVLVSPSMVLASTTRSAGGNREDIVQNFLAAQFLNAPRLRP
jgi:hypothetical protein